MISFYLMPTLLLPFVMSVDNFMPDSDLPTTFKLQMKTSQSRELALDCVCVRLHGDIANSLAKLYDQKQEQDNTYYYFTVNRDLGVITGLSLYFKPNKTQRLDKFSAILYHTSMVPDAGGEQLGPAIAFNFNNRPSGHGELQKNVDKCVFEKRIRPCRNGLRHIFHDLYARPPTKRCVSRHETRACNDDKRVMMSLNASTTRKQPKYITLLLTYSFATTFWILC